MKRRTHFYLCLFVCCFLNFCDLNFFFFFSLFLRGLDLSLAWPLLLPCLYLPNQTSQFCFSSQLLFAQAEKSRWQRLRHTLANMSALTRTHKFSNLHTRTHRNTHTFMVFTITSLFTSLITDKKPQTTTFLIKFLWALFCLTTPSLKNLWLTLFLTVFLFSGSEKTSVPSQGFAYVVLFFFPSVGLDGGRLMSLPPYWVCFKLTSHSWSHWWIRKGWGNLIAMAISFVRRYPWKMKHDLLLNVTASQFSAFFFLLKIQWRISAHSSCLFHLLCMKTAFSFFVAFVLVFWVVFLFFSFFFFSYFEIRKLTLVLGRFLLKVVETC